MVKLHRPHLRGEKPPSSSPPPIIGNTETPSQPVLAPPAIRTEKSNTSVADIKVVMASEQRRVFCSLFIYFLTEFVGLGTLLSSGMYQLGAGLLTVVLVLWIVCPFLLFLYVVRLSYRPIAEIHAWLDKNLPEAD